MYWFTIYMQKKSQTFAFIVFFVTAAQILTRRIQTFLIFAGSLKITQTVKQIKAGSLLS